MGRTLTLGMTLLAAVLSALCIWTGKAQAAACEVEAPYRAGPSACSLEPELG